jgi:hypothetical protein
VLTKYLYLFTCHWPPIGYLEVKGELGFAASLDFKRSVFLCMVSIFFCTCVSVWLAPCQVRLLGSGWWRWGKIKRIQFYRAWGSVTWPSLLSTLEATSAAWLSLISGPNQNSSQANSDTSSFISTTNLAVTCHRGACAGPPIGPLHQPPPSSHFHETKNRSPKFGNGSTS